MDLAVEEAEAAERIERAYLLGRRGVVSEGGSGELTPPPSP